MSFTNSGRPLAHGRPLFLERKKIALNILEMFRISLACLVGVATAATYDHDWTLMRNNGVAAAFNVGGEVR